MRERRGACTACGTDRGVTAAGKVRAHLVPGSGPMRTGCTGSGQAPAVLKREPPALVTDQMMEAAAEKLWLFASRSTEPWPPADPWDRDRYREVAGEILVAALAREVK